MRARSGKYNAKRTEVDGIVFASMKEARRYGELKLLVKVGEIRNLTTQPCFPLFAYHRTLTERGKLQSEPIPIGVYKADFRYEVQALSASENERWEPVVEDSKGFRTPLYRWKKKHVEAQYGITIHEV